MAVFEARLGMEVVERDAAVSVVAEKDEAPMDRVVVAMARVVRAGSWVAEVALEAHPQVVRVESLARGEATMETVKAPQG